MIFLHMISIKMKLLMLSFMSNLHGNLDSVLAWENTELAPIKLQRAQLHTLLRGAAQAPLRHSERLHDLAKAMSLERQTDFIKSLAASWVARYNSCADCTFQKNARKLATHTILCNNYLHIIVCRFGCRMDLKA